MKNIDVKAMHEVYENYSQREKDIVDEAYREATWSLHYDGVTTCRDDRAEELIAAITHYIERCRS